jgi:hypothetical protein
VVVQTKAFHESANNWQRIVADVATDSSDDRLESGGDHALGSRRQRENVTVDSKFKAETGKVGVAQHIVANAGPLAW